MSSDTASLSTGVRRRKRIILISLGALAFAAGGLALFWDKLPYQNAAARQIVKALAGYGIEVTSLKVDSLGTSEAALSDIMLGSEPGLRVGEVDAHYSLQEVQHGRIAKLEAKDISVNAYATQEGWKIGGIEPLMNKTDEEKKPLNLAPFFDAAYLRTLLPESTVLQAIQLQAKDDDLQFNTTLQLQAQADRKITADAETGDFILEKGPYQFSGALDLHATLDENARAWKGTLNLPALTSTGLPWELPPLALKGNFTASAETFQATLQGQDKTKSHHAELSLFAPTSDFMHGTATIKKLNFPWGGGMVSLANVKIPLARDKPIAVAVHVKDVELSTLLGAVSGGKIEGTGSVSGELPFTYHPDGQITLQEGAAQALEAGVIIVSPTLLPGDNAQLAVARTALENFHYTTLKISVSSDQSEKSVIHLSLEGRNPDALDGRPIKLNINLAGDVLPLLQQSLIPFSDPSQLLKMQNTP